MENYGITPRGIVFSVTHNVNISKSVDKDMCEYLRRNNLCITEDDGKMSFVSKKHLNGNMSIDALSNNVDELQKKHWGLRMEIHKQQNKIKRLVGIESVINFFTKRTK